MKRVSVMPSTKNITKCPFEHIHNPNLEARQITEITELTLKLLDKRYPSPKQILRGVHPKSHGCVKATFTINSDLAPEYQVGLFAQPGKQFDAIIRFSNATGTVGPDTTEEIDPKTQEEIEKHESRGMAIKVLDVGGDVLSEDNNAHNQDFLMINQPIFAFANTEDYLRLDKILVRDNDIAAQFFTPLFVPGPTVTEEQKQRIAKMIAAQSRGAERKNQKLSKALEQKEQELAAAKTQNRQLQNNFESSGHQLSGDADNKSEPGKTKGQVRC